MDDELDNELALRVAEVEGFAEDVLAMKGDCYEAALGLMMLLGRFTDAELVHGVARGRGPIEGVWHGHAWVELHGTVMDTSNGRNVSIERSRYYALGTIREDATLTKYTYEQMARLALDTGVYGPWAAGQSPEAAP